MSTSVFNPCGDVQDTAVPLLSKPTRAGQLYFLPVYERSTGAHVFALCSRVPSNTISHIQRLLAPRKRVWVSRLDFNDKNGPGENCSTIECITCQPRTRTPSRSTDALTRTSQTSDHIFRLRGGVRNSYPRLAATTQFIPRILWTAQVKPQTRPWHNCADVETFPEDIFQLFLLTLAFTSPATVCKEERHLELSG